MRSLQRRQVRQRERVFVVEGERAVLDALSRGARPILLLLRSDLSPILESHPLVAALSRETLIQVDEGAFKSVSGTVTPQGILAVFPIPEPDWQPDVIPLVVVADCVRDPGNFGTLLRAAAAAGSPVIVGPDTVDPYNPKAVRAGVGAHFRVPILPLDPDIADRLFQLCPTRVMARADAELWYDQVDWTAGAMVVIGGEAHGASEAGRSLTNLAAAIPLENGVESLNAGVAGAIFLFEARRQRRQGR